MYTMNTVPKPPPQSPWHSPLPYLFSGLAVVLGLIAFALLILACSYLKLSRYLEDDNTRDRDLELGEGYLNEKPKIIAQYKEDILVIMPGQEKPTFLATPVSSRASSFKSCSSGHEGALKVDGKGEGKETERSRDQVQIENMERHETSS